MRKRIMMALILASVLLGGCGNQEQVSDTQATSSAEVSEEIPSAEILQEETQSAEKPDTETLKEETETTVQVTSTEIVAETSSSETQENITDIASVATTEAMETIEATESETVAEPSIESAELTPISENGNPYNFPVEKLGYYTNQYWGFDFKQIDGDVLIYDKYEYGYLVADNRRAYIMDNNTFNVSYVEDEAGDVEFLEDGSFLLSKYQAEYSERTLLDYAWDAYRIDVVYGYTNILAEYGTLGTYQKQELGEFKISDNGLLSNVYDSSSLIEQENTQPIKNRRDYEKYPKYIKYIPKEKYYVCGNPETDSYFWLLKVFTVPEDGASEKEIENFSNPYTYEVELTKLLLNGETNSWATSSLDSHTFRVYSLGESQTEHLGLMFDSMDEPLSRITSAGYNDAGEALYFKMDCSNVDIGQIVITSNIVYKKYWGDTESDVQAIQRVENGALFEVYNIDRLRELNYETSGNSLSNWSLE